MPSGVHAYEENKELPKQREQTEDKEESISFITPPHNPENDKLVRSIKKTDEKAFNNEDTPPAPDHGNLNLFVNSFNHTESANNPQVLKSKVATPSKLSNKLNNLLTSGGLGGLKLGKRPHK